MAKSKIIKELVNNEISLSVALRRLYILADSIRNDDLKKWAELELNGYPVDVDLPQYRIFTSCELHYTGINGNFQVTDNPLPLSWVRKENVEVIKVNKRNEPISEIERIANSNSNNLGIDRSELAGEVEELSRDGFGPGVQCFSIRQIISPTYFSRIVNSVYWLTLKALQELEKVYGNSMDNLDVESGKISTQAKLELNENIANLLPIKKIVIKNSNIGSGSNMTTKQTDVNISPTISIQPEKKQSFLKRFWNLIKGKH